MFEVCLGLSDSTCAVFQCFFFFFCSSDRYLWASEWVCVFENVAISWKVASSFIILWNVCIPFCRSSAISASSALRWFKTLHLISVFLSILVSSMSLLEGAILAFQRTTRLILLFFPNSARINLLASWNYESWRYHKSCWPSSGSLPSTWNTMRSTLSFVLVQWVTRGARHSLMFREDKGYGSEWVNLHDIPTWRRKSKKISEFLLERNSFIWICSRPCALILS